MTMSFRFRSFVINLFLINGNKAEMSIQTNVLTKNNVIIVSDLKIHLQIVNTRTDTETLTWAKFSKFILSNGDSSMVEILTNKKLVGFQFCLEAFVCLIALRSCDTAKQ